MAEILHLNLIRKYFDDIAEGRKRVEYREQSAHWRARLEGRRYDFLKFRNGYSANAPEMLVEFRRVRRYGKGRNAYYAISLGKIIKKLRFRKSKRER